MRRLALLLVVAMGGSAIAQEADKPAPVPAPPPAKPVKLIKRAEVLEMVEVQEALRRREFTAYGHAERVTRDKAKQARILHKLLPLVLDRRAALAARIQDLLAAGAVDKKAEPVALQLLGRLYVAQADTLDRLTTLTEDLPENEREGLPYQSTTYLHGVEAAMPAWQQLVDKYPKHDSATAVLEELADGYFDAGRYDEAKLALQRLLCGNRDSELTAAGKAAKDAQDDLAARVLAQQTRIADYKGCVPRFDDDEVIDDAWLRLAWLHRSATGELDQAVSAYEVVAARPASPAYVNALHEMAVAYYEGDREIDAIPVLDSLVEHLDRQLNEEKVDEPAWVELRKQAVERLGRIVAELWRASAVPDPTAARDLALIYFRGRAHQRHVRDVFVAAGTALRSFGAFEQALPMWEEVLKTWPMHPNAPAVHARMIALLVEKGDSSAADTERRRFLDGFGVGSKWRKQNVRNKPALNASQRMGEEILFTLAGNRYRAMAIAAESGAPNAAELATDAGVLNESFLTYYPHSKLAYEAGYRMAHALLVSGQRERAVQRLRWVRDQDRRGAHFGDATRLVVEALEQWRAQEIAAGKLVEPPLPDKKAIETATAQPLPPLIADLQLAYDQLAAALGGSPAAARARMQAALFELRWGRIDGAEQRLQALVRDHCSTVTAREASEHLAKISEARGRTGIAAAAQTLFQSACGDSRALIAVRNLRIGNAMREAGELGAAGKWEEAGRRYWTAHRDSPGDHAQHDDALFLAADALRRAGQLDAARGLAWQFTEREDLRGSEYLAEALQLAGASAAHVFAYDAAVDAYLRLVDLAARKGAAVRSGFDLQGAATEALALAAELRDLDRIYYDRGPSDPGAVTLYMRYAARPGLTAEQSNRGYLRAAKILVKARDGAALTRLVDEWEGKLGKQKDAAATRVRLQSHLAKVHESNGDLRAASRAFVRVVEAYDASGRKAGSEEAALAAEAQFWMAEDAYSKQLVSYAFRWPDDMNEKEAESRLTALGAAGERAEKEFKAVLRFETTWSIAARVRMGDVYVLVADKLINAPPPKTLGKLGSQIGAETLDAFVAQLRTLLQPIYDESAKSWQEALAEADRRGDHGTWARHAREQLNRIDAKKYPVLREEIVIREEQP